MLARWRDGLFDFELLKLPGFGASFDEMLSAVLAAFTPHCEETFNAFNAFNYIDFDFPIGVGRHGLGQVSQATALPACKHSDKWHAGTSRGGLH